MNKLISLKKAVSELESSSVLFNKYYKMNGDIYTLNADEMEAELKYL